MNICGVLVHARAEQAAEVARDLAATREQARQ